MTLLATDDYGQRIQALRPGTAQVVPIGSSSRLSAAFVAATTVVRLVSTAHCFLAFGSSPEATAADHYLPAGVPEYFRVAPGERIAAIRVSADGALYLSEMA